MNIENNIIKHYLRNCYFINGTAYAGKSTMCRMLAERCDMLHCEENYNNDVIVSVSDPLLQPNLCYFNTMPSWQAFVTRTPDEYEAWVNGNERELIGFEIAELIRLSSERPVIVDTNIPCDVLREITEPNHVAIMLSPQHMAAERFFDRPDAEKQFLLSVIESCPDPQAALENFRACIARVNSPERLEAFKNSGFFTITRADDGRDTREENFLSLVRHFGLKITKK
jgi:hypothetical protein